MKKEVLLPSAVNLDDLLEKLRVLSWGAADILQAYARGKQPPYGFPKSLSVEDGGDGPVSAADLAVNSWLMQGLSSTNVLSSSSSWSLISEETAKDQIDCGVPIKNEWIWILDPLDGTKDFLKGTGEYAVHLALLNNNKSFLGVVLIPELEELWFGIVGSGAWCEDRSGKKNSVNFSRRNKLSEMILLASRSHRNERLDKLLENLNFGETQFVGSVGCKVAKILRGEADFYISLSGKTAPKDWDIAAPETVLRAAGGQFTDKNQQNLIYNKGDLNQWGCLVASHGKNHEILCETIKHQLSIF